MTNLEGYPCNRGMSGGSNRGLHHFQLAPGAARAACIYCGALGGTPKFTYGLDSSSEH